MNVLHPVPFSFLLNHCNAGNGLVEPWIMVSISILHPSGHDFNLKYFMDSHMPLVATEVQFPLAGEKCGGNGTRN